MPNVTLRLDKLEARKQATVEPDKQREPMTEETAAAVYNILLVAIGPEQLDALLITQGATLPEKENL
jgi:hypothetical protein